MKKNSITLLVLLCGLFLAGCFQDIDTTFDEYRLVELETAVRTTSASGATFPIVSVTRTVGIISNQVNIAGRQLKAPEEMAFSIDTAVSSFLNATTIRAVEGTHYNLNGGKFTFKADTSFSVIRFNVLNPGPVTGRSALLILKLDGNSNVKVSENYRRVGYRINLN